MPGLLPGSMEDADKWTNSMINASGVSSCNGDSSLHRQHYHCPSSPLLLRAGALPTRGWARADLGNEP